MLLHAARISMPLQETASESAPVWRAINSARTAAQAAAGYARYWTGRFLNEL